MRNAIATIEPMRGDDFMKEVQIDTSFGSNKQSDLLLYMLNSLSLCSSIMTLVFQKNDSIRDNFCSYNEHQHKECFCDIK